jgi:hypothetical protein
MSDEDLLQKLWESDEASALTNQAARRIEELEAKLAKAVEALECVLSACDEGRMIPRPGHGAGGMSIEANVKGSIYTGVPAWPIEEARTTLAELKEEDRGDDLATD